MKGKIELRNAIMIDGKSVKELTYDTDEITCAAYAGAEANKAKVMMTKGSSSMNVVEFDSTLHLYLGFAAIIAVNPGYDVSDLERIKGADIKPVMSIGRNFIMGSEEESQDEGLDEQSETMPESTTPQPKTSKKSE